MAAQMVQTALQLCGEMGLVLAPLLDVHSRTSLEVVVVAVVLTLLMPEELARPHLADEGQADHHQWQRRKPSSLHYLGQEVLAALRATQVGELEVVLLSSSPVLLQPRRDQHHHHRHLRMLHRSTHLTADLRRLRAQPHQG